MFIFIGFATGILYVLGTPPYYMLDEPNHFFRAYQVSQGTVIPERVGDKTGGQIPRSVATSVYVFRFGVQDYDDGRVPVDLIRGSMFVPLNEQDASFVAFSNTAVYSPVPYIPQALGVGFGRALDLSPLVLMYLGRFANLLVAIMILAAAMHILPVYRWVMFLIVLSPTAMFQLASLSADAMLFSLAFLFIAMVFRAAYGNAYQSKLPAALHFWLFGLTAGIALCKSAYIFLPLLVLLIPKERFNSTAKLFGYSFALVLVSILAGGAWAAAVRDVFTPFLNPAVDPAASAVWMLEHPGDTLWILVKDLLQNGWFYLQGLVGFQWNQEQVLLPGAFSAAYLLVILITAILSGDPFVELGVRRRMVLGGFAVLSAAVILVTVYLSWMAPGSMSIDGVQGRYFIPVLLPVLYIFYTRKFAVRNAENTLAIILPILAFVSLIYGLVMFHRLF